MNCGGKILNPCSIPWWINPSIATGLNLIGGMKPFIKAASAWHQLPAADTVNNSAATDIQMPTFENAAPWWTQQYFQVKSMTPKFSRETEINDAIYKLFNDVDRYQGHQPQFQMPPADPENVTFETGRDVWITKAILRPDGMLLNSGLYRFVCDDKGRRCVAGNYARHWNPLLLSPELVCVMAPIKDLQKESVEALVKGAGWKLHLNFDYKNPDTMEKIRTILEKLKEYGVISNFKIGHGGGMLAGEPGKEATVYIGHGYKARKVAEFLERYYSHLLLAPSGDTLTDDILITPIIAARFDLSKSYASSEFDQYGRHGVPFLSVDGGPWGQRRGEEAREFAYKVLAERFGKFFTDGFVGSSRPLTSALR